MNQPVRHNGALGAFCPCATCYQEFGLLDEIAPQAADTIPPPTRTSRVRDPAEAIDQAAARRKAMPLAISVDPGFDEQALAYVHEGSRFIAEVEPGSSIARTAAGRLVVAHPEHPPYYLNLDGSREPMPLASHEQLADALIDGTGVSLLSYDADGNPTYQHVPSSAYLGQFRGQVPQGPTPTPGSISYLPTRHVEAPRRVDRRKLVMWIGLGLFALGMAYLVGAPGGGL